VTSTRILVALAVAAVAAPALAMEAPDRGAFAKILPAPGGALCFRRVYDTAHLRAHPRQKVQEMTLFLRTRASETKPAAIANFALGARRRTDRKILTVAGDCMGDPVTCAPDCDGGSMILETPAAGDGLLAKLGDGGIRFEVGCDEGKGVYIERGVDDKAFLLRPAPARACRDLQKMLAP